MHLNNIKHTLYPYQERDMNNVIESLKLNRKVCFVAQTSYGKTISFSTVAKWYRETYNKKALVLCHREELVNQSAKALINLGMTVEKIVPSVRRYHHAADVYIGMEMTLHNRIKKNPNFLKDVGLVIIDECHLGNFDKHVNNFKTQKILGFTATPTRNERITYWKCPRCKSISNEVDECCGNEMEEWSRPFRMADIFYDIVVGASNDELIEFGSIVKDINFVEHFSDMSTLKTDGKGEFTTESQNNVYANSDAVFNCLLNYEALCKGKKTIIFNPSARVNKMIYEQFKESGYNIRMYDSVNETDLTRKQTVKWFEENDDAILCNVACFTTGFDSKEVQAIILNRAIGSLSLFLQCVGRGARASNKIYKDSFIVVDGGGNIERHNAWSSDRDWRKIFFEGIGKDKAKRETPLNVSQCENCGYLFPRSESTCPECGHVVPTRVKPERQPGETILTPIDSVPLPDGKKIAKYAIGRNEDIHFCFKVMYEQILDLFRFNLVSKAQYLSNKNDGRLDKRLGEIISPVYFTLISTPEFKSDTNRTLKYVTKKTIEKLDKFYNV